ncbi:hypothetical protein [Novosphingobium beihaiensis]|uniref:Uncharacterized protein n=1 Tax=Novosphingobium beihaiensis TaxID=2930389 RepID=A0ABT0BUG6_9SPHN|nr:hypothetical protein [Novosphingobium beihaiensis]MCJ2188689.1 hypothetical protein [Novosphingobium beihaiensis]
MSADIARGTAEQDEYLRDGALQTNGRTSGQDMPPGQEPQHAPTPASEHASGTQLRRRLVTQESIAELAAAEKPSLLQRLLRRK